MQFTSVIKNNLKETRRLVWLGGRTIDSEGTLIIPDKCLPLQLTPPEAKAMYNELHGGAITLAYVTDIKTVGVSSLKALIQDLEKGEVSITPEMGKTMADPNADLRNKMEAEIKRTAEAVNAADKPLGKVQIDAKDASEKLADQLVSEGALEDFMPARTAFTEADKEAAESVPPLTEAFKEPEQKMPDPFTKSAEGLFNVADAEKPRRRTRKEG
jgi:hypothetical protein